jgi:YtkA-like
VKLARALALAGSAAATPALAAGGADCGADLRGAARWQAENERYAVAFVPRGQPVAVGQHFSLEIAVCPRGHAAPPSAVKVDADMPAHRHGMNYRASVTALGAGRYRADGLMFHMPGRWRFIFELAVGATTERLTREVDVE